MGEKIRGHIRSNVVGYVALFVALSGTAYAVDGPLEGQNTVGSEDIINQEVKTDDLQDAGVRTADLRNGVVNSDKIADGAVQTTDLGDNAVGSSKVLDDSLTSTDLANGAVGGAELGFFAVSTIKIQPDAVAESKLAENAVDPEALGNIVERRFSINVGPGLTELTSPCNSNEQVISGGGGGGGLVFEEDIDVIQSFRSGDGSGNGWTVRVINRANADRVAFVDAYCLDE